MKVKNLNRSAEKTKNLIRITLAELIAEKQELDRITVTELSKKANITRSTFYTHYNNIYELANDFQLELLEVVSDTNISDENRINLYFDKIFEYLRHNEKIYCMILTSNEPFVFMRKLCKVISKNIYETLKYTETDIRLQLNVTFFIDGCIQMIIKYFRKELLVSLEEINQYMKDTFQNLFFRK